MCYVDTSFAAIIEGLTGDSKERFNSLVVFDHCVVFSTRVLSTMWSMDECGAEEIMNGELLVYLSVCLSVYLIHVHLSVHVHVYYYA